MKLKAIFAATALSLIAGAVLAQPYPTKPITMIVPWPAGGPSDIAARPLGKGLSESPFATGRAAMSEGQPAGHGTTTVTGLVG